LSPFAHKTKRTTERCSSVIRSWSTVAIFTTETSLSTRACYLDCHESGLCCYLVVHTENLLRPLQLFHFHLWPIYWLHKLVPICGGFQWQTVHILFHKNRSMMFGTESEDGHMQIAATVPKTLPCVSESQLKSLYLSPQKEKTWRALQCALYTTDRYGEMN
jgi:hypothetical protein